MIRMFDIKKKKRKKMSNLVVLSLSTISYNYFSFIMLGTFCLSVLQKVGYVDLKKFSTPLRIFIF